jgi:hypothetical protein
VSSSRTSAPTTAARLISKLVTSTERHTANNQYRSTAVAIVTVSVSSRVSSQVVVSFGALRRTAEATRSATVQHSFRVTTAASAVQPRAAATSAKLAATRSAYQQAERIAQLAANNQAAAAAREAAGARGIQDVLSAATAADQASTTQGMTRQGISKRRKFTPTPTPTQTPTPTPTPTPTATVSSPAPSTPTSSSPPPPVSASTAMPVGDLPGWKQVYADDFSGSTLDTYKAWSVYNGGAPGSNPTTGWWMASHAVVSNGMLNLRGYVDKAASPDGRVVTAGLGLWKLPAQTYGKYEILARIDKCAEVKYAWLLWPYSGKWPDDGEIDFAEDEGGDRTKTTASLLFKNALGQADALPKDYDYPTPDLSGWHRIGVEWTPTSVRYTMDGQYWGQPKTTHIPTTPMTLVLQTEGKYAPSAVTLGSSSCDAQIGWVTQYAMG